MLCKPELLSSVEDDDVFSEVANYPPSLFYRRYWSRDLRQETTDAFTNLVEENKVSMAATNVEGKYSFLDVKKGNYCLAATTTVGKQTVFWFVPTTISVGQITSVDLNNSNIDTKI